MQEPKQYDLSTVNVGFTSPVTADEVKENLYVHYMIGDVAIREQKIKEVKVSDDGLTAAVTIYDTFVPEVQYKITYGTMDPQFFKAATTNPEDVADIEITTTEAKIYENTTVKVNLVNKDGVIINQPVDPSRLGDRVTFESSNDLTSLFGNVLVIFKKGDTTTITATYHTYEYDNGVERVFKNAKPIVGVEESTIIATGITAWTITDGSAPKFDDVKQFIAAGDFGRRLYVQLKLSNDDKISNNDADHADLFKLTSSNSQTLFVDDTGYLVPVKQGAVRVTVEYDKRYVGSFEVVVSPERRAARLEVDKPRYDLSNNFADLANVTAKLKDQYGDDFAASDYTANITMKPLSSRAIAEFGALEMPFVTPFDPEGLPVGNYQFLIYDAAYTTITGQVVFNVQEPDGPAVSWKMTIVGLNDDEQVDVVVNSVDDINKTFGVELMGYARNGVKVGPEDLSVYDVVVKDAKGVVVTGQSIAADGLSVNYDSTWSVGDKVEKRATGRYTAEAIAHSDSKLKARGVFVIVDSQKAPTFTIKSFRSDSIVEKTAFMDAFEIKLHDNVVLADDLAPVFESTTVPTKAFAKSVIVTEYINDADGNATSNYIEHELKIGYYITVPVDFDSYSK
jgi:hypothetical protein